jgi:hypothetical protein
MVTMNVTEDMKLGRILLNCQREWWTSTTFIQNDDFLRMMQWKREAVRQLGSSQ